MADIIVAPIDTPSEIVQITASATGDQFQNDGRVELELQNDASHAIQVTILAQRQPAWPENVDDYVFTVPANEWTRIRTLPPIWFNDVFGKVQLRYPVALAIASGGAGYAVGDELTVLGGVAIRPAKAVVLGHSGGVITSIYVRDAGVYSSLPANPAATSAVALNGIPSGGSGATLTVTSEASNLKLNAYRNPASR